MPAPRGSHSSVHSSWAVEASSMPVHRQVCMTQPSCSPVQQRKSSWFTITHPWLLLLTCLFLFRSLCFLFFSSFKSILPLYAKQFHLLCFFSLFNAHLQDFFLLLSLSKIVNQRAIGLLAVKLVKHISLAQQMESRIVHCRNWAKQRGRICHRGESHRDLRSWRVRCQVFCPTITGKINPLA